LRRVRNVRDHAASAPAGGTGHLVLPAHRSRDRGLPRHHRSHIPIAAAHHRPRGGEKRMIPVRTCPRRWPHASRPCTVSPPAYAWRVLSVEELSALPAAALASQLAEAYQVIGELTAQVGRLSAQVEQLERQARRNSSTSSRPPSSDS